MGLKKLCCLFALVCFLQLQSRGQQKISREKNNSGGWFSIGARSTASLFSDDGFGIGTGGQFRLQLSDRVNTDWFADYIVVSAKDNIKSQYIHIGWSVLFYPFKKLHYPDHKLQPYILAGHCFDYNRKTLISDPAITKGRWGSAVQAGIGTHFNLSERFDISLTMQYMLHLTKELEAEKEGESNAIVMAKDFALEGHLLATVSINYKIAKLWKR